MFVLLPYSSIGYRILGTQYVFDRHDHVRMLVYSCMVSITYDFMVLELSLLS